MVRLRQPCLAHVDHGPSILPTGITRGRVGNPALHHLYLMARRHFDHAFADFSAPPYNFSVRSVGATNLSSFVASVIGTMIAGPLIDGIVKRMSKRNKGVFEPEFRLPIMVTYLLFTATGFFGWGQAAFVQDPWPIPGKSPTTVFSHLLHKANSLNSCCLYGLDQLGSPTRNHRCCSLRCRLPS